MTSIRVPYRGFLILNEKLYPQNERSAVRVRFHRGTAKLMFSEAIVAVLTVAASLRRLEVGCENHNTFVMKMPLSPLLCIAPMLAYSDK